MIDLWPMPVVVALSVELTVKLVVCELAIEILLAIKN